MPFFQVDDQLPVNRKSKMLAERCIDDDTSGMAAMGLWTLAGAHCQASGSDGVVSRTDLIRLLLNQSVADELARLLVDAGLWHPAGHDCSRCPEVPDGSFVFHDWFALGYDPAVKVRETRAHRRELKDPQIVEAVWARDAIDPDKPTVAQCRYCGTTVKRHDHKSPVRPTLDHVDPAGSGVRNIVVACDPCNKRKGRRTPAQAGMTLQPPPARRSSPDPTGYPVDPDRVSGVPYARAGVGVRQGQGGVSSQGQGEGQAGQGSRPRKRRRRGRGGQRKTQTDAGPAPEVSTAGQFGSPWHGWRGPPSPVSEESVCPEHGLDEPCRKCEGGDDG